MMDSGPLKIFEPEEIDFRYLVENINIGVCRISAPPQARLLKANNALTRIMGFDSIRELLTYPLIDHFCDSNDLILASKRAKQNGYLKDEQIKVKKITGEEIWISCTAIVKFNGSGGIRWIDGVIEDITERKLAEEKLRGSFNQLQKMIDGTIQTITTILEIRDPYTAGHQKGVRDVACSIAKEMGLSQERIDWIEITALIHDIGKIYIPAEVLCKPGKLTEIEFDLMKAHPEVGCRILRNIDFSYPVSKIVYQHHERMNGSGYPKGLKGDEIMLEARIIGVADVIESMSSHRPYRPALGMDKALEELQKNRGILYDTEVVGACLRLFGQKKLEFE